MRYDRGTGGAVAEATLATRGIALAAEPPPLSPTERAQVGHRYFVRYCSACHGAEGGAMGPLPQPSSRPRRIARTLPNSNKCLDCRSTDVVQYGKQAQGTQR